MAADSEPLVVEEDFATCISQDGNALANFDESVISVFKDSGFFADALSDTVIPEEPTGKKWNLVTTGSIYNISHGIAWCVNDYSIFRDSA